MIRFVAILVAILAASPALSADQQLVSKKSANSVALTLDRLSEGILQQGLAVIARVDHAAAAQRAGLSLRPTEVLFFGSPKAGTPLMQVNRTVALELPMKVLAWEDDSGQVWITYAKPERLKTEFGVTGHDKILDGMTQALERLTDAAALAK